MCVNPEAVCGSCVVLQVFPRKSKFANCASSDQLLVDIDSPFENDAHDDSAHESAAADSASPSSAIRRSLMLTTKRCLPAILTLCLAEPKRGVRFRIDDTQKLNLKGQNNFGRPLLRA